MKRLALLMVLILSLALVACDTMGPQPPAIVATDVAPDVAPDGGVPAATDAAAYPAPSDATSEPAPPEAPADSPIGGETAGSNLTGVTWEWAVLVDQMGQTEVTDPTRYTAVFNADGTLNLKADCNTVISQYITNGASLEIVPGVTTLVACETGSQDQLFLNSLNAAESYMVQDGELYVVLRGGSGTMIFRPGVTTDTPEVPGGSGTPALTGVTWEWVSTTTGAEVITVADPTRYTMTFDDKGMIAIKADCNNVIASYVAGADNSMGIVLGPATLMACPADSQADLFTAALPNVAIYSFIDGNLVLDLPASSGSIVLRPAGATTTTPAPSGTVLTGITWEWVSTTLPSEEITVADPTRYQITFNEDGTAGLKADCNVGNAEYTAGEDGSLTIILGVSTMALCENSQDAQFRAGLEAAATYAVDGNDLHIELNPGTGGGTMRFRSAGATPPPPASGGETGLTGVTWQWVSTVTPMEEITVADPSRYTLVFFDDGTMGIKADCNVGNAEYTAGEDKTMSILLGVSTLAFCENSQDQVFRTGLEAAAVYFFDENGDLMIDMIASSGTMRFVAVEDAAPTGQTPSKGEVTTPPIGTPGLVGPTWQLTLVAKKDGQNIPVNDPTRYAITFNADGTANIKADCNSIIAAYVIGAGNTMTVTPGPSTLVYCGPSSLDQVYMGGLTNTMGYRLEDGNLLIDMLYASGTLVFAPAR